MASKLPTNLKAERALLSALLIQPDKKLPLVRQMGLKAEQFSGRAERRLYSGVLALHEAGKTVDVVMLVNEHPELEEFINGLGPVQSTDTDQAIQDYARLVISAHLHCETIVAARDLAQPLYSTSADLVETMSTARARLDQVMTAHRQTLELAVSNPADALGETDGWSVSMGIKWFDDRLRYVSGRLHFLAADPNKGKSSCAIQAVGHNVRQGVPSAIIIAEDSTLDVQLTLLAQVEGIDMVFVNRVQFDPTFKTESNIDVVRKLWDEHYKDAPLRIVKVSQGPDEVVAAIQALPGAHFVVIDHAYAVISQAEKRLDKEHQSFMAFFTKVLTATKKGNHVMLILNQYTKSARTKEDRGPDAQYGGSGILGIGYTIVHMWGSDSEFSKSSTGVEGISIQCVKAKARLLLDEQGNIVNPEDGVSEIYILNKYRLVFSDRDALTKPRDLMF